MFTVCMSFIAIHIVSKWRRIVWGTSGVWTHNKLKHINLDFQWPHQKFSQTREMNMQLLSLSPLVYKLFTRKDVLFFFEYPKSHFKFHCPNHKGESQVLEIHHYEVYSTLVWFRFSSQTQWAGTVIRKRRVLKSMTNAGVKSMNGVKNDEKSL